MKKIYLAAPYTSPDPIVRNSRVELASIIAARLMDEDYVVFSPITHGHSVANHLYYRNAHSHDFWMRQCLPMVKFCDWLIVLPIHGWRESRGIAEEMAFAKVNRIPTFLWQTADPQFELLDDEEIEICQYSIFRSTNLIDNEKEFA